MVTQEKSRAAWKVVAAVVVAAVVVSLAVFLLLGNVLNGAVEDERAQQVTDVEEGKVPQFVYEDVEPGADKEELLAQLRPALPVDARTLARYQERSPETVGSECVYYEAAGGLADDLFRFCFVDDELVDKTVVLPDDAQPAG